MDQIRFRSWSNTFFTMIELTWVSKSKNLTKSLNILCAVMPLNNGVSCLSPAATGDEPCRPSPTQKKHWSNSGAVCAGEVQAEGDADADTDG